MTRRYSVVGLFPELVRAAAETSVLGRAKADGRFVLDEVRLRDFATDKHHTVDDTPAGGGPGLVMKIDVVAAAIAHAKGLGQGRQRVVLMSAAGGRFDDAAASRLAGYDHVVFVCGRFEGIDARVAAYVDEALSIGDYVLTGGELAASVMLDAVLRKVPDVLGNEQSAATESHVAPRLEHRQYTRPVVYEGRAIPPVLMSGHHGRIEQARKKDGLVETAAHRPDLLARAPLSDAERRLLDDDRVETLAYEEESA